MLLHLAGSRSFLDQSASGADLDARPASRTGVAFSPRLIQIGDDLTVHAASHDVPSVRTFDFVADPHATSAQDATIVINAEPVVGCVHFITSVTIGNTNVINAALLGQIL